MGLLKQIERILCMCIWNTIARWYLVNYMFMLYFITLTYVQLDLYVGPVTLYC